ncbi:hypothetical protein DFH07DRAFT_825379 [Mycena maculata]|uniref:Uncharacterized protein n=1 Tax=Mycena maculata TaxID=230809 RepID=A0AAD7N9I8_9AGAR|nr:hypothetical protein DFH07DRAFT_825379 [Mycena maculata]
MVPPELVELIVYHAWGCLSSSHHRHAQSMTSWMLVSRDWLKIVLSVVFRDLWITSYAHIMYILRISTPSNTSFILQFAGITDVHRCEGEYAAQCTELLEFATTDSQRVRDLPTFWRYEGPIYAIPRHIIGFFIRDFTPRITVLHFVLIDCVATCRKWDMTPGILPFMGIIPFPLSLIELHVTFAYTSPPPTILLDAPRGTFYPPPSPFEEMPKNLFDGVRRLVVRDANADFVAFLTTRCPRLERVESTAEFCVEDVPKGVSEDLKAKLVFVRLTRTTAWPGLAASYTGPMPKHLPRTLVEWCEAGLKRPAIRPNPPPSTSGVHLKDSTKPTIPARNKRNSIWRLAKRVFRGRK